MVDTQRSPTLDIASSSGSPDSDAMHTFTPMGTVEDFFNFDLLSGPSGSGESSSRGSSRSPQTSFWHLPPSPKIISDPAQDAPVIIDPLFDALYNQQVGKGQDELFSFLTDSPMAFAPSTFTSVPPFDEVPTLAIDPQLTATTPSSSDSASPSVKRAPSSHDEDDLESIQEELEADEALIRQPHKVGGRGKSNRKGTVVSGGIRKNTAPTTQAVRRSDEPEDEDDWRPTAEEYKKMSSKEKRQLRNKISARNFRVRRKEYITTLEGDIAQRDNLIDVIRTELSSTKMENQSLRREVEALKKALLKGGETLNLPPPAPLSETIPAFATNKKNTSPVKRPATPLATPNTQKDLPLSPRVGANGFWGGRSAFPGAGVTPVHTTLVPEFSPFIPDKLAERARARIEEPPVQQENMNPNLNTSPFFGLGNIGNNKAATFEGYNDANLFNFKNMDSYRMHLWSKMGNRPISQTNNVGFHSATNMFAGDSLAGQLRPSYFSSPRNNNLKESDGKKAPTPTHTPQQAIIASLVSQTFMSKLTSSFWDAFSSSPVPSANKKDWDMEKVRKVVEGKAVLRVVEVPQPQGKKGDGSANVDALEQSLKDLAISSQRSASGSGGRARTVSPPPAKEKMMLRSEPCFLQGLRTGTSPLSSKK